MDLGYLAAAAIFMVYAAPGALSAAVYLAAVSAFDLRSREVPVWALVSFAPAAAYLVYRLASEAAALGLAYAALLTYIPFLVVLPAAALMARRGVLGYGDLFILSAVLLLDNYYISTPTPLGFVHANLIVIACSSLVPS